MNTIQMVPTSDTNSIFILGFDVETNVLTFRTILNKERIQKEVVVIDDAKVYTNLFYFSVGYLQKFLDENEK